jgi:hypothetical protein
MYLLQLTFVNKSLYYLSWHISFISLQMDLVEKFKMSSSCQTVKDSSLTVDKTYLIEHVERVQTRYGEAILLTLRESQRSYLKIFLPKLYGVLFSEANITSINERSISPSLKYMGTCPDSNSYILQLM